MNYFEFFDTHEDVLQYIERLKEQGYFEEDIHLITEDEDFDALNYMGVVRHMHLPDNQVKEFFSRGEKASSFMRDLEFTDEEVNSYLKNVEQGQYLIVTNPRDLQRRNNELRTADNEEDYRI